jgi:RND family efflux transporter MFP subunit
MKKVLILFGIILIIALAIRLMTTQKNASAGASSWRRGGNTNRTVTVTAAEVEYKNFRDMPVFTGDIKPIYDISIPSRITARIEKITKKPGEFVKADEVIAFLENAEEKNAVAEAEASLALAQAQLKEAESNFLTAEKEFKRSQSLFDKEFISEVDFESAQAKYLSKTSALELAKAQLVQKQASLNTSLLRESYTALSSPRSGLVGDIHYDEGNIINQNSIFTNVVVIDSVICEIQVPEAKIAKIKRGMPALVERATEGKNNSRIFEGIIHSVSPVIDIQSRTATVQVIIPNQDYFLKAGMFARISLVLEERNSVLAVPEKAIVEYKNKKGIFSVVGDSIVTFIPVETGLSAQGFVEIISEQKPEKVVTEGQFMLSEGAKILIPSKEKSSSQQQGKNKNEG